jgi:hypothetical protein
MPAPLLCAGPSVSIVKPPSVLLGILDEKVSLLALETVDKVVAAASETPAAIVAFVGIPVITPLLSVSVKKLVKPFV